MKPKRDDKQGDTQREQGKKLTSRVAVEMALDSYILAVHGHQFGQQIC
jgi:hypothetical protein